MKTTRTIWALIFILMMCFPARADQKAEVPSDEALTEVRQLLDELYADQLIDTDKEQRHNTFASMLKEVEKFNEEPVVKYGYLEMILNHAVKHGDVEVFQTSVALLTENYQLASQDLILKHLPALSKTAPKDSMELLALLLDAVGFAINEDDYKVANVLLTRANTVARAARDKESQKQIIELRKQSGQAARAFNRIKRVIETLEKNPEDPEANAEAGKYYALIKRRWDKGLLLLAKGDDAQFKQAAEMELKGPKEIEDQVALADQWWALAGDVDQMQSKSLKIHAGKWYQQALPELSGLPAVKAKSRLNEIEAYLIEQENKTIKTYAAVISITCDNVFILYHNGKQVGTHDNWGKLQRYELKVKTGDVIGVYAKDHDSGNKTGGLFCSIKLDDKIYPSSEKWFYTLTEIKGWNTSKSLRGWKPVNTEMVHPTHLKKTYPETAGRFFWCNEPKNIFYAKWIVP